MQACQKHWDMLRDEVKAQGLDHLVSANGEIMAMKFQGELQHHKDGEPEDKDTFDPLMRCWFMIMNRTLEMIGVGALTEEFGCPICKFNSQRTKDGRCACGSPTCQVQTPGTIPDFETWLVGPDSCVTSVKEMCIEKGWINA